MDKYLIVWIWTHCSWKSSYAREMLDYGKDTTETFDRWCKITLWDDVFALWHYHNNCWWVDWCWPLKDSKQFILDLCTRPEKIMFIEWVLLLSDPVFEVIRQAWEKSWRKVIILYLIVWEKEALQRVYNRNWWKKIGQWLVNKKRYYDKRIKELEKKYTDFEFNYIDTEQIMPKEAVEKIKKDLFNS